MPTTYIKDENQGLTIETIRIVDSFTTTNSTPQVVLSYPTATKKYKVKAEFGAGESGVNSGYSGDLDVSYDRSSGTLVVLGGGDTVIETSSYNGDLPIFYTQPNGDSIEFVIKGLPSTTLNWGNFIITLKYKT